MDRSNASTLRGIRVLVLEDEFFLADDLARSLRAKGAEPVGPVSTIQQARELIAGKRPGAAIVDINLNGETAYEFVEQLAADMPCLIVSGYGRDALPESVASIRQLEKPVNPAKVVQCLAEEVAAAI